MDEPTISLGSVLLGAVLTGAIDIFKRGLDRRNDRRSVEQAIKAEVSALCRIIRANHYVEILRSWRDGAAPFLAIDPEGPFQVVFNLVSTSDYMEVYRANLARIGQLHAIDAANVVLFYSSVKSLADSVAPGADLSSGSSANQIHPLLVEIVELAEETLKLGDLICGVPHVPIPVPVFDEEDAEAA